MGKAVLTEEGKSRLEYALADGAGDVLGLTVGQGWVTLRFLDFRHFHLLSVRYRTSYAPAEVRYRT
jgi:hypothetical protein